jgi:hypothetical protein
VTDANRDELRDRYLGYHAIRRFAKEMRVSIDTVKDVGDIGCTVGQAVGRVRAADRERAWRVAEKILADLDERGVDEGGEA